MKKNNNYISKISKKIKLFSGALSIGVVLSTTSLVSVDNEVLLVPNKEIVYQYDDLYNTVDENESLTQEEKEFIKNYLNEMKQYEKRLDIKAINNKLSTLDVMYEQEALQRNYEKGFTSGLYSVNNNEIVLFSNNFDDMKEDVFDHELMHVLEGDNNESGINEAMAETLTSEQNGNETTSSRTYYHENLVLYSLCELIGSDPFLDYYSTGDIDYIRNELLKINDSEEDADTLLTAIDVMNKYTVTVENVRRDKEIYYQYYNNNELIYNLMNKYFKLKYNKEIEDIPEVSCYLNNNIFRKNTFKKADELEYKGYFDENYKKSHYFTKKIPHENVIIKDLYAEDINNPISSVGYKFNSEKNNDFIQSGSVR